jgi:hypothetical protein
MAESGKISGWHSGVSEASLSAYEQVNIPGLAWQEKASMFSNYIHENKRKPFSHAQTGRLSADGQGKRNGGAATPRGGR